MSVTQRYLPSAAAARKRLLDHMAFLEAYHASHPDVHKLDSEHENRKWYQIYSYSYSESLTGCVKQLEQLQKFTKEIVGEQGWVLSIHYFRLRYGSTGMYCTNLDTDSMRLIQSFTKTSMVTV
jgi:hypothetical protein